MVINELRIKNGMMETTINQLDVYMDLIYDFQNFKL